MSDTTLTPKERCFYTLSWVDVNGEQHDEWFKTLAGARTLLHRKADDDQNHNLEINLVEYRNDFTVYKSRLTHRN